MTLPENWSAGVAYGPGTRVVYNGIIYKIIQPHTSQSDWAPNVVPALWGFEGPAEVLPPSQGYQSQQPGYQAPPPAETYQPPQGYQQQPIAPAHQEYAQPQQPQGYESKPSDYQPPVEQTPEKVEGYDQQPQEEEHKQHDYSNALKIGAGVLGGVAVVGALGAVGYGISQHLKHKKEEQEASQHGEGSKDGSYLTNEGTDRSAGF
ncbi:hypothetical protein HK098_008164 [Nowakowskiella sp. JEL0407]|nr:hypothetical protein HK098_008164 [Nowakowskiella sp. JEL0407]